MGNSDPDEGVEVYDVVAAHQFAVVDSDGRPRIVLGLQVGNDNDDIPFIKIMRADGTDAITIHCEDDGRALLMLNDADENVRVSLRVTEDGDPDVVLFASNGEPKVELSVFNAGGDLRIFNDKGGGWSYGPESGVAPGGVAHRPPYDIELD